MNSTILPSVWTWNTLSWSQLLYFTLWNCFASWNDCTFAMLWELCLTVTLSRSPSSLVLVDPALQYTVAMLASFLMFFNSAWLATWFTVLWLSRRGLFLLTTPLYLFFTNKFLPWLMSSSLEPSSWILAWICSSFLACFLSGHSHAMWPFLPQLGQLTLAFHKLSPLVWALLSLLRHPVCAPPILQLVGMH
jgi:hypothetical protein